ncbi:MAG: triacylglycerol lipase [Halioglobus sp.]|jgi:triacylglycerol lipase
MHPINLADSLRSDRLGMALAAINGVMGDRFKANSSPLATNMGFYHQNRPLALTTRQFEAAEHSLSRRLVVFVHGLSCHEQMWAFPSQEDQLERASYGSLLMQEEGATPLYLRYNSGLHISENGRLLSVLLEELLQVYPEPIEELVLVGHSLGGLLIRSACHYGRQTTCNWVARLSKAIYLGTPHHGVPWQSLTANMLLRWSASNNLLVQKLYSLYEGRSASVRDIVDMALIDEHWQSEEPSKPVDWFDGIEHFFIAGSINEDPNHLISHAFGDVLVPIGSAQARSALHGHMPAPRNLQQNCALIPGVKHIALAHNIEVYAQLRQWLNEGQSLPQKLAHA